MSEDWEGMYEDYALCIECLEAEVERLRRAIEIIRKDHDWTRRALEEPGKGGWEAIERGN